MAKKENLFTLIKSLTKAEKRYLKIQLGNSDTNYARLFDAIDAQEYYDEAAIKEMFNNEKFVNQLHVTKNYLLKTILKALRNFHSNISIESEVKDLLKDYEILFSRELYDMATESLVKAKKLCLQHELYFQLPEILSYERKLITTRSLVMESQNAIKANTAEEQKVLENLKLINSSWLLLSTFMQNMRENKPLDDMLDNEIFYRENHTLPFEVIKLKYHLLYVFYLINNKYDEAKVYLYEIIDHMERNKFILHNNYSSYVTMINNLIALLLTEKEYDEVLVMLNKIRKLNSAFSEGIETRVDIKALLHTYNVEMELYRDTNNLDEGKKLIPVIDKILHDNEVVVPVDYKAMLSYQSAMILFCRGEYELAISYAQNVIDLKLPSSKKEIITYARFLYLMIQFELNNIDILKYAVESVRRYLKKNELQTECELLLLSHFSRLSTNHPDKYNILFAELKTSLENDINKNEWNKAEDYLNLSKWIEKNINKKFRV